MIVNQRRRKKGILAFLITTLLVALGWIIVNTTEVMTYEQYATAKSEDGSWTAYFIDNKSYTNGMLVYEGNRSGKVKFADVKIEFVESRDEQSGDESCKEHFPLIANGHW